jgi:hypothetical protein
MKTTVGRMLGMVWVCGPGKVLVVQEGNGHGKGEIERGHLHQWIGSQRGGEVRQGPSMSPAMFAEFQFILVSTMISRNSCEIGVSPTMSATCNGDGTCPCG